MAVTLTNTQEVPVTVDFLDATGQPAPVTSVSVSTTGTGILQPIALPAETGPVTTLAFTAVAAGPAGAETVTITATNADGAQISGSLEVDVTTGPAVTVTLVPGTPEAIPAQ